MRISSEQQELLKFLAVALMIVDHTAAFVLGVDHAAYVLLRALGRLSFPLFSFLIAYNLSVRGVPARTYLVPLLITGVLSQVVYAWVTGSGRLNIFFTLLAGVLLWHVLREATGEFSKRKALAAGLLTVAVAVAGAYGLMGVLLLFAWDAFLTGRAWWRTVVLLATLAAVNVLSGSALYVGLTVASFPLVLLVRCLPGVKRLRQLRWFWYGFYPLHLLVLGVLNLWLEVL